MRHSKERGRRREDQKGDNRQEDKELTDKKISWPGWCGGGSEFITCSLLLFIEQSEGLREERREERESNRRGEHLQQQKRQKRNGLSPIGRN